MSRPRFPEPVERLLYSINKLPGVGPKTALRYVFALLRWTAQERTNMASALAELNRVILKCAECNTLSDKNPCAICADPKRDGKLLCVVAEPQDLLAIESTGSYGGRYYVLGSVISPLDGLRPDELALRPLLERVGGGKCREVILAFDPDAEGEATMLYLTKILKPLAPAVSRLGRGIPVGGDLEYADAVTLSDALSGRRML
ncbi:recombination protein RecR [Patescibacteria group bacterium]|nr:MAG: recombination protein RecR [Patescibacteria group bacterium]